MKKLTLIFTLIVNLPLFAGIGSIQQIRNDVFVVRDDETLETKEGFELLQRDVIITGEKSKAKLVFEDNTRITVGKNSIFEIQDYLFDKSKNSKASFKAKHGFFSAITGEIGKVAPDSFALKTKTATIGVRGTAFEGEISPSKESVACTKGTIAVSAKGKTIILNEGESLEITEELFKPDVEFIGEIKSIEGVAFIINGEKTFIATVGHQLRPKERLVTSYNSKVKVILVDSAEIELHRNSGFIGDYKDGGETISVLKGAITIKTDKKIGSVKEGESVIVRGGTF